MEGGGAVNFSSIQMLRIPWIFMENVFCKCETRAKTASGLEHTCTLGCVVFVKYSPLNFY